VGAIGAAVALRPGEGEAGGACREDFTCPAPLQCFYHVCWRPAALPKGSYIYTDTYIGDAATIRATILAALELRPGMRLADIGAGAGELTVAGAIAVGPSGKVYATDINAMAVRRLDDDVKARGLTQVDVREVKAERDTGLADVAK
jgi:protein-L-isoaspartate O-methyltransferase